MEFGHLGALAWGLLAIPVVIFYILKVRLRRVPVSTVMFWDQVFQEKRPRSFWRQLRHLLSLLVQLAFLGLLVAALSDPIFPWEKVQARQLVLVVDNSASMNATDEIPNRLEKAKQEGLRWIDGLRPRDELAIVTAGSTPKVASGLTSHAGSLREALRRVPASDGPTSVMAAVAMARRLLAGKANGRIIVLSDGSFHGLAELARADDVALALVGRPTDNVGITQFQVRRSLIDPIGYEVFLEVSNYSAMPVECRLEIDLNDNVVDVLPLKLAAEEHYRKTIEQTSAAGGRLTAHIDREDALSADNRAVALLPERKRQPVLLVTSGNVFLERVLEAIPIVDLKVVGEPPAKVPPGTIVIFHRRAPAALPAGNVLVIDPAASCACWTLGPALENPLVVKQDADSPLMTHVRLENVFLHGARRLELRGPQQPLISSLEGQPLYAALVGSDRKVLVLTADLEKGDLPLRIAFPIMLTNAIQWFQGGQGELQEAVATGSIVEVDFALLGARPPVTSEVSAAGGQHSAVAPLLYCPDGSTRPLPSGLSKTTIGPLDRCGVWSVRWSEDASAQPSSATATAGVSFACNLANPRESDLRCGKDRFELVSADANSFGGRPAWFYLAFAAFVLTAGEWCLYQRRWIS